MDYKNSIMILAIFFDILVLDGLYDPESTTSQYIMDTVH